jgi:hypothetical protein
LIDQTDPNRIQESRKSKVIVAVKRCLNAIKRNQNTDPEEKIDTYTRHLRNWTGVMAVVAIMTVFVLWKQYCESISVERRTAELERAYVFLPTKPYETFIDNTAARKATDDCGGAFYQFRNLGKTPAMMSDLHASVGYVPNGYPALKDAKHLPEFPRGFAIPPNESGFQFSACFEGTKEDIKNAKNGAGKIFFWGYVDYLDVFKECHRTVFGWEYVFRHRGFEISSDTKLNDQKDSCE